METSVGFSDGSSESKPNLSFDGSDKSNLERYFENIVVKVRIIFTYRGVQKNWSRQVSVYLV